MSKKSSCSRAIFATLHRRRLWVAVACSRLLVLAAGAAGSLFTHRVSGWQLYDPERLSSSLGAVGNVLAASAYRWDGIGYVTLAQHGYATRRSLMLFPFYPVLIRLVTPIVQSPVIAGVLISLVAFSIGLALVHRIAAEEVGSRAADVTVLLLAFSPLSFVFSAVYTGGLLLALAAGTFYLARRGQFVLASVAAACATLTHVQGIVLLAPLALMYWKSREPRRLADPGALALALPPLALGGLFLYMHLQGWGWLAPITSQNMVNAGRSFVGPPIMLFDAIRTVVIDVHGAAVPTGAPFAPVWQNAIYLLVLVIAVFGLVSAWRRMPKQYAVFGALAILICTSSAVAAEPLKGFDRYMLPVFPLWIGVAAWLAERRLTAASVLTVSTVLLTFYTIEFSRWVSVF